MKGNGILTITHAVISGASTLSSLYTNGTCSSCIYVRLAICQMFMASASILAANFIGTRTRCVGVAHYDGGKKSIVIIA